VLRVRAPHRNNGTVQKSDQFVYVSQMISYNEPDNVTCSECGWAVHTPWHYLHQLDPHAAPPPPPPPAPKKPHNLTEVCAKLCCKYKGCVGFLFEEHADVTVNSCKEGGPCCWFKSHIHETGKKPASVGATIYNVENKWGECALTTACTNCDSAGADVQQAYNPEAAAPAPPGDDYNKIPPPMGIRSSPALGGVVSVR
jgi:hypothetical protein